MRKNHGNEGAVLLTKNTFLHDGISEKSTGLGGVTKSLTDI
jgi:hypothetical protein